MARRSNATNGVHVNSDAPPASTIAAQIVQNQTRPAATQHSGEQAIFKQLLQEILHNPNTEQETDVNINAQLIGVVVEAGLAGLATENPFANWDELRAQAVDSIHVIQATIQRQPEVLLAAPSQNGPPVLLNLLATLLSICGKVKFHNSPIVDLLDTSIRALQTSVDLWHHANHLREVIQACVDDVLSALEISSTSSSIPDVKLPPVRSVRKIWSEAESSIAIPRGIATLVNEPTWAFVLSLELCQAQTLNDFWRQNTRARCERLLPKVKPQLEKTKQWDHAVVCLLRSDDNFTFLASLIDGMRKQSLSSAVQSTMATSVLTAVNHPGRQVSEILLPSCCHLLEGKSVNGMNVELREAVATLLSSSQGHTNHSNSNGPMSRSAQEDGDTATNGMTGSVLRPSALQITPKRAATFRRRKMVSIEAEKLHQKSAVKLLTGLLTGVESHDLSAVPDNASIPYSNLSEIQQCAVWQCLIDLIPHSSIAMAMTSNLLENGDLHRSKKPRVLSLLAIGVYVQHSADPYQVSLGTSQYGRFCLQALHSSLRELRIAAGQTLPNFLGDSLPDDIKKQNRQVAIEYLRTVSDRDVTSEQETLVAVWTQVGLACSEKEMNLVLLRLVQYLGHANSLICALAFSEIEKIAGTNSMSIEELFSPFWRTIAISVVQDLQVKPQKAQQVCDLLGKDVNGFLTLTQREILPTLVLSKNHTVLRRIAEARGKGSTIRQVCTKPIANLAGIITLLLNHFGPGGEEAAFACLLDIDADFRSTDLSDLVEIDAGVIACEMLLHCGDQDEARKPRSHQAFYMLVSLSEQSPGQRKSSSKTPPRTVASFFEKHILGILTHFSKVLVTGPEAQSLQEKARCLRGIEEMFKLAKGQVSFALPQIRACLQSGLDQPELREIAFGAWLSLIPVLDDDDITQIVDETFALVLRHWSSLSLELQKRTHDLIAGLVKTHNLILQEKITTLPSLDGIPVLSKFAAEFGRLRSKENVESRCRAFAQRLQVDSDTVVFQAIIELIPFLEGNQDFLHETAASEHPAPVLSEILRALLDVTVKYAHKDATIADSCGKALGIIGCLDPNRVETVRKKREVVLLSNFDKADEVVEWVIALFEDVLVKAFKSVTNTRAQGFLAYAMQELLKSCNFTELSALRSRSSQATGTHQRWLDMPEHIRTTLTPFLTSRYLITSANAANPPNRLYPSFSVHAGHSRWLRNLTADLVLKAKGDNANIVFPLFSRLVRTQDLSIARWILPYISLNIVLGGTVAEVEGLSDEFLAVLESKPSNSSEEETVRISSDNVFAVLDYMTSWLREKSKTLAETRVAAFKTGNTPADFDEEKDMAQIETVEQFLTSIPAVVIANQAMECRSYARALFHWEQHIREKGPLIPSARQSESKDGVYERLLDIYAQIEEPDGLEGISAHLPIITEQQRATNHAKAGRWTAAQAWYELQLSEDSHNTELQTNLLNCFGETGQFGSLLKYANSFLAPTQEEKRLDRAGLSHVSRAMEACWMTENIRGLETYLQLGLPEQHETFNVGIGKIIVHAAKHEESKVEDKIAAMRRTITEALSTAGTESLQTCHDEMKRLHVLYEIESLMSAPANTLPRVWDTLNKRLAAVGSYVQDKQYILGLRRTIMRIRQNTFKVSQTGALWVNTAKLARQAKNTSLAYNAVLKAVQCGNRDAALEEARLLWHEGHQRQAIQSLDSAIQSGLFDEVETEADVAMDGSAAGISVSVDRGSGPLQNKLSAKAHLLLAKWLDASGQSQTNDMTERYQMAARRFQRWEKGHYYLGKHYSKLLDAQKALPKEKRSQAFLTGEMTKLVVDNILRSIPFGNKYWHETIPRLFTLWLELGSDIEKKAPREDSSIVEKRIKSLQACNKQMQKYFERVPPYVFYHALPQLISRITHPHPDIWKQVCNILTRIVSTHPSQALWSLLAVIKARDRLRVERGMEVLNRVKDAKNRAKPDTPGLDLRVMIQQGQRLSEGLLQACEIPVDPRTTSVNLFTDLNFNHKLAPSSLVVPIESTLTASSLNQATSDDIRKHKAFTQDKITIQSFRENVVVLSSLQRPRKITLRGSDGKDYGLLCKPKDDLRKDQRLMEFNGIINRALKRNTESSKRRLYIKTYAVTPLSEESGTIEWVEGIKPMRDILLNIYSRKGTRPNYNEIRKDLEAACAGPEHAHLFAERILTKFPPCLHEWFSGNYPQPDRWFAARLRYARSAAVMSMTGHILGLGDRHGENILLEESTGGVFHVDFNCLFDKGLTFDKPELVPFRLTHNMVDAMGPYGVEGPFRKSCELTLSLLRQERDTLMTILETFLYDPTTDFIGKKKRSTVGVPETPAEILESVATKLRGLLRGETVPLSVEGHVDALIQEATDAFRLASMYIGWCSFL